MSIKASPRKTVAPPPGSEGPVVQNQPLAPGTRAPRFELNSTVRPRMALEDFLGQPVILAFYPADWSPVCSDQMAIYQEIISEFEQFNAQLLGSSVDSVWCHIAWAKNRRIKYPLLSDFEPKGQVARAYNAYRMPEGVSERALYVVDSEGTIHWSYISPITVNPGADGILQALEDLTRKEEKAA